MESTTLDGVAVVPQGNHQFLNGFAPPLAGHSFIGFSNNHMAAGIGRRSQPRLLFLVLSGLDTGVLVPLIFRIW